MKKKIEVTNTVEISICNVCGKEVKSLPFHGERLKIVRGLGKTSNFDAHEACINKIVRQAFKKYF